MTRRRGKSLAERAIKKSVSMPTFMFVEATQIQREERLPTFSDLVQMLIRQRLQLRDANH